MKKIIGILGVGVFSLTLFLNSTQSMNANAYEIDPPIGSNNCVCKVNQGNICLASNFISFRKKCGEGSTDSACQHNGEIGYGGGVFQDICKTINPQ